MTHIVAVHPPRYLEYDIREPPLRWSAASAIRRLSRPIFRSQIILVEWQALETNCPPRSMSICHLSYIQDHRTLHIIRFDSLTWYVRVHVLFGTRFCVIRRLHHMQKSCPPQRLRLAHVAQPVDSATHHGSKTFKVTALAGR